MLRMIRQNPWTQESKIRCLYEYKQLYHLDDVFMTTGNVHDTKAFVRRWSEVWKGAEDKAPGQ
jgi:hypothetical protein